MPDDPEATATATATTLGALKARMARHSVVAAVLAGLTAAVFAPGLRGRFLWDDHALIERNPALHTAAGLARALGRHFWDIPGLRGTSTGEVNRYYRPVVTLAYAAQWWAFGGHPAGFHSVSLALHIGCVLLAWTWLRRRLGDSPVASVSAPVSASVSAALGAALFALHPSRPESVSWISGSTDLWMTLGVLAALVAWDRGRDALAALALVLALLAKETAVVVPALLALDALLLAPSTLQRRQRLGRAGAVALVLALAAAARFALVPPRAPSTTPDTALGALRRVLATLGCYVHATAWHWPPTVHLGVKILDGHHRAVYPVWAVPMGLGAVLGLTALALVAGRRPAARPWLADAAWFLVPLAPALNLANLRLAVLAEPHNLYLPLLGVAAAVARAADGALAADRRRSVVLAAVAVLPLCAGVSIFHQTRLHDDRALWTWEHQIHPDDLLAVQALVTAATQDGRHVDALRLDAEGCATAQRQHLRATTADFARGAAEEALAAAPPGDRDAPRRILAFCEALARPGVPARLDAPGAPGAPGVSVRVPADATWRRPLSADPRMAAVCAVSRARAAEAVPP